jgi:membrane protein
LPFEFFDPPDLDSDNVANKAFSKFKEFQEKAMAFFEEKDLEQQADERAPRLRRFAHFWLLVGKSFVRNRCPIRASALAYATLLALIPMLAVALSITTSVLKSQGDAPIRKSIEYLVDQIAPYASLPVDPNDQQAVEAQKVAAANREDAVKKINEFIRNTQSGAIGVTGTIALVAVAISMLIRIESTFNDIWGVTRGRAWYVQVVLYWAVISLGPILLAVALGLTSGPHFEATKKLLLAMPVVGSLVFQFLPLLVLSFTFGLFYQLMPNTRVQWQAAGVGGLAAGGLWHLNNLLAVNFLSRVTQNNAIYGSLSAVPVFMINLYFGWLILLFGAQVAYAFQNRAAYVAEKQAETVNHSGREFIALRLMTRLAKAFQHGERPPTVTRVAKELGVPSRLVGQVLQTMLQARLVVEAVDRENGFAPARPLDRITVHDILSALRSTQGQEVATRDDADRARVRAELERIRAAEQDAGSVTLEELAAGHENAERQPEG